MNEALKDHFEVLSVTFQTDKVNSRALDKDGWRYTPYAYLLLKAKGPQVDKLPALRLDLDFLDTSGYVIIPIETPQQATLYAGEVPLYLGRFGVSQGHNALKIIAGGSKT